METGEKEQVEHFQVECHPVDGGYSEPGWVLLKTVECDVLEQVNETVADPERSAYGGTISLQKEVVLRKAFCVLGRTESATVKGLTEQAEAAEANNVELRDELRTIRKERDELVSERARLEAELEASEDKLKMERRCVSDAKRERRNAEGQVAKLRAALGDLKMSEILEGN
jgi:chromosome segregation ATPase